jgi:hypothetical protein
MVMSRTELASASAEVVVVLDDTEDIMPVDGALVVDVLLQPIAVVAAIARIAARSPYRTMCRPSKMYVTEQSFGRRL